MGRRTTSHDTTTLAMVLVLLVGFTTSLFLSVEAAFQDGITGSSLRFGNGNGNGIAVMNDRVWPYEAHQQSRNLQASDTVTSAMDACETARAMEEADISPGGGSSKCSCRLAVIDERYAEFIDINDQPVVYELTCIDRRCSYCSADGTTCDRFSYGAIFEETQFLQGGTIKNMVAQVGYFETNQYITGRPEAIVYTEYSDRNAPGAHACSMEIDGLQCAVCEYVPCVSEEDALAGEDMYFGMRVVCSNIKLSDGQGGFVAAADFETCDPAQIEAIGASQGVFQMYDPDYGQCFTSVEGCDRDKTELEQTGYYSCECLTGNLPTDGVSPFLENVQLSCEKVSGGGSGSSSQTSGICGETTNDTLERTYSSYVQETNTRSIRLKDRRTVTLEEFDCLNTKGAGDGCSQCRVSIDGASCDSCAMASCNGIMVPQISCGNILGADADADASIDLCRPESAAGTPFEALGCGFGESSKVPVVPVPTQTPVDNIFVDGPDGPNGLSPVSMMACKERWRELASRVSNYIDSTALNCGCYLIDEIGAVDSGTLLECSTVNGSCKEGGGVCNGAYASSLEDSDAILLDDDGGNCFREEMVQGFLPDGNVTPMTRTTTYTKGSSLGNSLVGRTLVLTEYGNGSESCQLLVDGEICNSCFLQNCGNGIGMRPMVDCSNVVDDPTFSLSTCDDVKSYENGFLLRLAAGANANSPNTDFSTCMQEPEPKDNEEPGGNNNSNNNNDSGGGSPVDPSLPATCQKAQPIVLPSQTDDPVMIRSSDLTNPNVNFALLSFVASTKGLPAPVGLQESCAKEGLDSPGLWYSLTGSGKGVHASVCREATDFEARISVYEGSCEDEGSTSDLRCVVGTIPTTSEDDEGSPCNVHWLAEEGKQYHIRVHGSDANQVGTFNLFLETLADDVTDNCFSEEDGEYDQACLSCSRAMATRVQQFSKEPSEIDCRCLENELSRGYHLTCVDMSCLKCNGRQDTCGFDTYEMEINRAGENLQGSYESFYFLNKADGIQAQEVVSIQETECLEIADPYQQCMYALEETVSRSDEMVFCQCRGTSAEGDYMLLCSIYDSYEYCAGEGSDEDYVCADVLFGQSISQYGMVTSEFRNYKIISENEDEEKMITVERTGESSCAVSIGDDRCSKCEVVENCPKPEHDGLKIVGTTDSVFTDLRVDCSNVLDDAEESTFDCSNNSNTGILSIIRGSDWPKPDAEDVKKEQTIPPDAFPPTMPPVTKPTNPPTEPSMAPVRVPVVVNVPDLNSTTIREEKRNETASPSSAENFTVEDSSAAVERRIAAACLTTAIATIASLLLTVL